MKKTKKILGGTVILVFCMNTCVLAEDDTLVMNYIRQNPVSEMFSYFDIATQDLTEFNLDLFMDEIASRGSYITWQGEVVEVTSDAVILSDSIYKYSHDGYFVPDTYVASYIVINNVPDKLKAKITKDYYVKVNGYIQEKSNDCWYVDAEKVTIAGKEYEIDIKEYDDIKDLYFNGDPDYICALATANGGTISLPTTDEDSFMIKFKAVNAVERYVYDTEGTVCRYEAFGPSQSGEIINATIQDQYGNITKDLGTFMYSYDGELTKEGSSEVLNE